MPYQSFFVPPAIRNFVAYPWGMTHHSPQVVDADNHEIPQGQTLQTSMHVTAKTPDDNEPEYKCPRLHFHVPPQDAQPIVQNLNQGIQIPPPYPRAPSVVAPQLTYSMAPYAPYRDHYGQTVGQMVNPGMMYPQVYP